MSIQGDGNAVHKAKDHSRDASRQRIHFNCVGDFEAGDELARDGEPDALKGACPVREGLH